MGAFRYAEASFLEALRLSGVTAESPLGQLADAVLQTSRERRMALAPDVSPETRRHIAQFQYGYDVPDVPFSAEKYVSPRVVTLGQMAEWREHALVAWEDDLRKEGKDPDKINNLVGQFRAIDRRLSEMVTEALREMRGRSLPLITVPITSDIAWVLYVYKENNYAGLIRALREEQEVSGLQLSSRLTMSESGIRSIEREARILDVGMERLGIYINALGFPSRSPHIAALVSQIARDGYKKAHHDEAWTGETVSYQEVQEELALLPPQVNSFGTYLKYLRERHPKEVPNPKQTFWSQGDLAEASGIKNHSTIARIESGKTKANIDTFYRLLYALGYTPGSKETIAAGILALEGK